MCIQKISFLSNKKKKLNAKLFLRSQLFRINGPFKKGASIRGDVYLKKSQKVGAFKKKGAFIRCITVSANY